MSVTWPTKKLGELADICRGSSPRPICDTKYFDGGTVPWVKIADATKSGKFLYKTKEHVNDYGASFSRRLPPGTILVAASGTLGYTQILGVEGCAHDGWLILQKLRELDRDFAYYALKTLEQHFFNSGSGAAIQNINTDILREAEIPYPPLPVQRRIAGILSAYDELIENSQRRIRLLEDMTRALYREWFVHFRFPGHESVPRLPSALGDIPQGWEVKKLSDILELNYGKALKKEDRREGEFPVFGSSGQVGSHDTNLVKGPGIIVGRKGNVGSVFWCDDDYFVIDTAYFVSSALPLRFLFYLLPTLNFINSDAAVPGLSRNQAYTLEVAVPPAALLTKFCELAESFERQASNLRHQINNLRRTRDLLLPRLLSGAIPVS